MARELSQAVPSVIHQGVGLPVLITREGPEVGEAFFDFFVATIRNVNTRKAYARAVWGFLGWCEGHGLTLQQIRPVMVAAYIEELSLEKSKPTVKQTLAAIKGVFDFLVVRQVVPFNPANSVKGPSYKIKKGKTPVLSREETKRLIASIEMDTLKGLRDRALVGVMLYSFARVGAVIGMKVRDYERHGHRATLRLHEKGGKEIEVPAHHNVQEYVEEYLEAAGINEDKKGWLFRSFSRRRELSPQPLHANDVNRMLKSRGEKVGLSSRISPHSFRATGITVYLENGGALEHAQQIAAHESPRTTKLYDRSSDQITLDEIERIML